MYKALLRDVNLRSVFYLNLLIKNCFDVIVSLKSEIIINQNKVRSLLVGDSEI